MRIIQLKSNPKVYSCNVYLVRGDWNTLSDVNTLIDTGADGYIIDEISSISTGAGKTPVEQVVLTHEHFDHTGGLGPIKEKYNPKVYSYAIINGTSIKVHDNMELKIGDTTARILYTPGHSHDSICVYFDEGHILFSGDTTLNIRSTGGSYDRHFVEVLERLSKLKIKSIYPGHEYPYHEGIQSMINNSLENVLKSKIID